MSKILNATPETLGMGSVSGKATFTVVTPGDYSLETVKSEGGYTHTFTGKLDGYASTSITGGVPSPVGNGKTETS